jgi:hypothetical protein
VAAAAPLALNFYGNGSVAKKENRMGSAMAEVCKRLKKNAPRNRGCGFGRRSATSYVERGGRNLLFKKHIQGLFEHKNKKGGCQCLSLEAYNSNDQADLPMPNTPRPHEMAGISVFEETTMKSLQACRTRVILTEEQVIRIYQIKLANDDLKMHESNRTRASQLANEHGVSDKTVRDIWKGRTWYIPFHLFALKYAMMHRPNLQTKMFAAKPCV